MPSVQCPGQARGTRQVNRPATETGPTADKLKLAINAKTGLLSGSFLPQAPKLPTTAISGVIYQKSSIGVGQFLNPAASS